MKRNLSLTLNPAGLTAAAGAIYAAVAMLYNAHYHHGVINSAVIIAGLAAVAGLLTRQVVTPTADPRDGNGKPLVPAAVAAETVPPLDHPPAGNL